MANNVSYQVRRVGGQNWKKYGVADRAFDDFEGRLSRHHGPYYLGISGEWGPGRGIDDTMHRVREIFANHDPGIKVVGKPSVADAAHFAIRKVLTIPSDAAAVLQIAMNQLGDNYTWGAEGPDAFDCSGFTAFCYEHGADVYLPHSAYYQYHDSAVITFHDESKLVPGDLLFYDASTRPSPNHVGIYAGVDGGERKVIDASSSLDQIVYRKWDLNPLIGYGYVPSVTGQH